VRKNQQLSLNRLVTSSQTTHKEGKLNYSPRLRQKIILPKDTATLKDFTNSDTSGQLSNPRCHSHSLTVLPQPMPIHKIIPFTNQLKKTAAAKSQ
jgi:hypothetical protein